MAEILVLTTTSTQTTLTEETVASFQAQLRGPLVRPEDADYDAVRQLWNKMMDKRPALIARCTGASDVITSVDFAREHNLLVAIKGGGHSGPGLSSCDGGLMIDLSLMRGVRVDPEARTVRAQAGCNWGDVDHETQRFGLAVTGGVVSDTGIAGLTLGGGLSWMRRKWGMTIDNLLSVDLVTPDGQYLTASETENRDLFWGIRGGGGNFGVVTSFEYRCHELGPTVMFAATMYPREKTREVLSFWREFVKTAPDEITSDAIMWTVAESPMFPEALHGTPFVMLAGMYAGPVEEGEKLLQPLREVTESLLDMSGHYPYTVVQTMFDPFLMKGEVAAYFKSIYLDEVSDPLIDTIIDFNAKAPSPMDLLSIRNLGGALSRVDAGATAFGDRSAQFLFSVDAIWTDLADTEINIDWGRRYWAAVEPLSKGQMYFNFPGLLEEGDTLMRDSFGANYERLTALKRQYDPTNLLRLNQNIKPNGSA